MRLRYIFTLIYYFMVSCLEIAQFSVTKDDISEFESFVENVMICKKVVGLGITLVHDKEILYAKGFGFANIEKSIPVNENSKFAIGSLTKAFTSTILAKVLYENRRYNWDTPIKDILGTKFKLFDDIRTENVNLRDLLGHKVGIPGFFEPLLVGFPENTTREGFIRQLQYQPPAAPIRTTFIYSNYFYALAGYVAEQISRRTWEDLVQEYLFDPLLMDNSGFVDHIDKFDDFALGYSYLQGKPVKLQEKLLYTSAPSGPAGSIYSTPKDMGNWILFHLNEGRDSSGSPIVDNITLKETYRGQMATPFFGNLFKPQYPISDTVISYNMGWLSSVYRGYNKLWHSGGIVGYSSLMWLFPDTNVAVFASMTGSKANSNSETIKTIVHRAADMLLGLDPWLNDSTACSYPEPWSTNLKTPIQYPNDKEIPESTWNISIKMEKYVGVYCNPAFGALEIRKENSKLILKYGRFGKMKIYPITEKEFDLRYMNSLWFVTHSDNNITPKRVTFSDDFKTLYYPLDRKYKNTTFTQNCKPNDVIVNQGNDKNNMHSVHGSSYLKVYLLFYNIVFVILFTRRK